MLRLCSLRPADANRAKHDAKNQEKEVQMATSTPSEGSFRGAIEQVPVWNFESRISLVGSSMER